MKQLLLISILLVAGCLPATQTEVQTLTNEVAMIVPAVRAEVAKANVGIEDVLTKVEEVNEAVATAENPVEALKVGVTATKDWNPYAVPILAGISLLEALGILREKKKVTGLEKGINRVKGEAEPQLAKSIHDTMKIYTG